MTKIKYFLSSLFLLFIFFSCTKNESHSHNDNDFTPIIIPSDQWYTMQAERICSNMTIEQKASQVLLTGIDGSKHFSLYLESYFEDNVPGGILLFKYNIADNPLTVFNFLDQTKNKLLKLGSPIPVFFAIDNEGGMVFRTRGLTTTIPSPFDISNNYTLDGAYALYSILAMQLQLLGIQVNIAPVVETQNHLNSLFLGKRSFSSDPSIVEAYSRQCILAHKKSRIINVIKHFPANIDLDPHFSVPLYVISKEDLINEINFTFLSLIESNLVDAILLSHIIIPEFGSIPFCFSKDGVSGFLKNEIGYSGLIITDDISMNAITSLGYSSAEASVRALEAGCDMIMTSDSNIKQIALGIKRWALENSLNQSRLDQAVIQILLLKFKMGLLITPQQSYLHNSCKEAEFDVEAYNNLVLTGNKLLY